jgi:hypothetical protein
MTALETVRLNHDMVVRSVIDRTSEIRESTTEIAIIGIMPTIRNGNGRGIEDVTTTERGITIGTGTGMGIVIGIETLVATDANPEDRTIFFCSAGRDIQLGESYFTAGMIIFD